MFERVEESLPWFELSVVTVLVVVELSSMLAVAPSLAFTAGPAWVRLVEESVAGSVVWAWAFRPKASDSAVTSKVLFMQIPLGVWLSCDWQVYQLNRLMQTWCQRRKHMLKSLSRKHKSTRKWRNCA